MFLVLHIIRNFREEEREGGRNIEREREIPTSDIDNIIVLCGREWERGRGREEIERERR